MPNPNAIVTTIARTERAPADALVEGRREGLLVELEDGRRLRFDADDARAPALAAVLDRIAREGLPVYLEVEPGTDRLRMVRLPLATRVARVHETGDGLVVELEQSHARHVLRRGAAHYDEMAAALRQAQGNRAPLLVTTDDAGEIVDASARLEGGRDFPFQEPDLRPPRRTLLRLLLDWVLVIYRWPWWPWWWFRCISAARAQQVFDDMAARTCDPVAVPPPCIPFLYPDDGCWARAHEMCRLMIAAGLKPRKVWIESAWPAHLHVDTRNNPSCFVDWGWHVAPILCVRAKPWFFPLTHDMVIDPSLFTTPVTKATWKAIQNDPAATLTDTDASIYWLWTSGTDPNNVQTDAKLAFYRTRLQLRSAQVGPPPYANCP